MTMGDESFDTTDHRSVFENVAPCVAPECLSDYSMLCSADLAKDRVQIIGVSHACANNNIMI